MSRVTVKDLRKKFGQIEALRGVSLTVEDGGFIAVLGPSGCGKTTLLRLLSGLEMPTGGAIEIGDRDVSATPPEKRNIGLMFQSYALFPHMTVAENLAFPLKMRRNFTIEERRTRIANALDLVRLPAVGDRYPKQLSGGQQQRVALARAVIDEPSVLLLDEPLSNLDARLRDEMQLELLELRRKIPITTVLVTHDQAEGLTLADRIVVMRDGRIEQTGSPREVYSRPATAFVADFLGGANVIRLDALQEDGGWTGAAEGDVRIAIAPPPAGVTGAATLVIRQEHVRILASGETADAEAPAVIDAVAYRGQAAQVALSVGRLRLRLSAAAEVRPTPGEQVRIGWSFDDARLLAASAG